MSYKSYNSDSDVLLNPRIQSLYIGGHIFNQTKSSLKTENIPSRVQFVNTILVKHIIEAVHFTTDISCRVLKRIHTFINTPDTIATTVEVKICAVKLKIPIKPK